MENTDSVAGVVGRGTAWLASTTLLMKGVGAVSILLILNHLTVSEYGFAELVISIVPLLSLFLLPGLNNTVIADMGRERGAGNLGRVKGLFLSYLRLQLLFAITIWAIVFFGSPLLATGYGQTDAALFFQIISFAFLLSPLRTSVQTLQSVYLRFSQVSLFTALEEVGKLLALLCLFYLFHLSALGLVLSVVVSQVFSLLLIAVPLARIDPSLWRASAEQYPLFHFLLHHGKWGIFSSYLGTAGKNIRPWIINSFLGTEAVGLFAVVQGLIGHTVSLVPLDAIVRPMFPQYVQNRERLYRFIAKAVKYELLGYLFVSSVAAVGVPLLISWFFPQYVSAVPLFQVTLFMLVSSAFDAIFSGVYYAIQAQRNLFMASAYKFVLTVLIMPLMLPLFGLLGIAYANILVNYLYVYERYVSLKKLLPHFSLAWREIFTVDEYDRAILSRLRASLRLIPGASFFLKHPAHTAPQ